jgi:hypothetical protein
MKQSETLHVEIPATAAPVYGSFEPPRRRFSLASFWHRRKKGLLPQHRIEIKLRDLNQLFNSMDPSPFHEKDLDHDAEDFIEGWAQEFPRRDPVTLVIHLDEKVDSTETQRSVEKAVRHYFAYKANLNGREFNRLMKQGRTSLLVGLSFLGACLAASELVARLGGPLSLLLRESLAIAGSVAMWRPMEIYLYEWWPLRRRGQIFEKMSHMPVAVHSVTPA